MILSSLSIIYSYPFNLNNIHPSKQKITNPITLINTHLNFKYNSITFFPSRHDFVHYFTQQVHLDKIDP